MFLSGTAAPQGVCLEAVAACLAVYFVGSHPRRVATRARACFRKVSPERKAPRGRCGRVPFPGVAPGVVCLLVKKPPGARPHRVSSCWTTSRSAHLLWEASHRSTCQLRRHRGQAPAPQAQAHPEKAWQAKHGRRHPGWGRDARVPVCAAARGYRGRLGTTEDLAFK